ncbi:MULTISPECIES: RagB/SusD family nutrient uptake outer membrane protein [Butyricimonas]|uniref:RagB/SusD family nutrient uptake outer membrane protein n=1 Tax=Butyricimonas TaxID=574697 RepID=UPI0007FB2398|nr:MULTISPECIES: RagB/SusD family nutrient uptake outer membrane protein [Butyricimonas]
MKCNLFYISLAVLGLIWGGCSDFLEEYSKDQVYASSCKDLDEVLIGNGYMKHENGKDVRGGYYPWLFVMDDDAEELVAAEQDGHMSGSIVDYLRRTATWQKDPFRLAFSDMEITEESDEKLYAHIAYVNTIINYVDEFPDEPLETRMRIRGEGLFLRAAYYLMSSNLFGRAYDAKNKGADLSIPLKTFEWVTEAKFTRATVGEVYGLIESDLRQACECLDGVDQRTFYRADHLAASILLSRLLLYMERYDEVIEQCDSALLLCDGDRLSDLRTYKTEGGVAERDHLYTEDNPEIVFTMGNALVQEMFAPVHSNKHGYGMTYTLSESLIREFDNGEDVKDLRFDCYFQGHNTALDRYGVVKNAYYDGNANSVHPKIFDSFLIRTVEIYLNKAEAQAMKGDLAGAAATLQPLLNTRYAEGMLPQISALGEKDLVDFIRSERRKELCFEGHRWPDLKRYAVNTKYPYNEPIRHSTYAYSGNNTGGLWEGYYELGKYGEDEGWIMPYSSSAITYNEGLIENPDRPERSMLGGIEE